MQHTDYALDFVAFGWFLICISGYWFCGRINAIGRRSIMSEVQKQRVLWMRNMMAREVRLMDMHLIGQLSSGHAFFASTSIIVIGGLAAAFSAADHVKVLMESFPMVAKGSLPLWEAKILVLMVLFIHAFFQFAWAFRLAHYTGIMIGSAPSVLDPDEEANARFASELARLAGLSAEHSNNGLRSYYFALAAITWFLHPVLLIVCSTGVVLVLYRREYASRAFLSISRLAEIARDKKHTDL